MIFLSHAFLRPTVGDKGRLPCFPYIVNNGFVLKIQGAPWDRDPPSKDEPVSGEDFLGKIWAEKV